MKIPVVTFTGQVAFHEGPMTGLVTLYPGVPAFEWGEDLYGTLAYAFELDPCGRFDVEVLPTNIGVKVPWKYCMVLPDGKSVDVGLPLGGPHSLNTLLRKQD